MKRNQSHSEDVDAGRRKRNNERGFTLLEVIVAISILAIGLLAVASMQISSIRGNSFAGAVTSRRQALSY